MDNILFFNITCLPFTLLLESNGELSIDTQSTFESFSIQIVPSVLLVIVHWLQKSPLFKPNFLPSSKLPLSGCSHLLLLRKPSFCPTFTSDNTKTTTKVVKNSNLKTKTANVINTCLYLQDIKDK